MNRSILILILLSSTSYHYAQTQLDIQGVSNSTDTVAIINVNYTGSQDVVGLGVYSEPNDTSGIAGYYYSGFRGIIGESASGWGMYGISSSSVGVYGKSADSAGVYGNSLMGNAVIGHDQNGDAFDFYATGPGFDYGSSSSVRWKHHIRNILNPINKLSKLRGVYFNWDKEHGGHNSIGFIAEEVGEILP